MEKTIKLHWPPEKILEIVGEIRKNLIRENQDNPEANLDNLIDLYEDIIQILQVLGPILVKFQFPVILDLDPKKKS